MQIVVFTIGKEEYGLDIQNVQEIVRLQERTKLPNLPEFFEGVINLRGKVIPVLNLAKKFNLQGNREGDSARLIVLSIDNDKSLAVMGDKVTEVLTIDETWIEQAHAILEESKDSCVTGIVKLKDKLVILLDSNKIIDTQEIPKVYL